MSMRICTLISLLAIQSFSFISTSCTQPGELFLVREDSTNGFHYPYFLFLPKAMEKARGVVLIIEPNNTGFNSDKFSDHVNRAKEFATDKGYLGRYLALKLNYPLLVPVFPRPEKDWLIYTHALDRDAMIQKDNHLERLDLQLLAMVKDCQAKLAQKGHVVENKVIMAGFSASGTFVNRFTALHPNTVKAAVAGGVNGMLLLPLNRLGKQELNYPIGVNDSSHLVNTHFDSAEFRKVPQFLFMGSLDDNDAIPFKDGYDDAERNIIYEQLGQKMLPDRWSICQEIYRKQGVNVTFKTYEGIGHQHNKKIILDDILTFIKTNLEQQQP